jgi:hypothetical protein
MKNCQRAHALAVVPSTDGFSLQSFVLGHVFWWWPLPALSLASVRPRAGAYSFVLAQGRFFCSNLLN